MTRTLLAAAGVVALAYLAICVLVFAFQRSLIYFPQPREPGAPAPTLVLAVDGTDVLVTVRPGSGSEALIYFGGNAENVSYSLPDLARAFPEHSLYLMHYRGYGGSGGKASEAALFADGLALFDRVHAERSTITVVGRSLGSGVAVHVASRRPVARLVLVTPYDSIEALAIQQFPYLPVRWLLRDKFDSGREAPAITAPTLLIAAEHDEVIPRASTEALLSRFSAGVASLGVVAGAGHNTIAERPEYGRLLSGRP
ncbi:MAG: alpha/beta hydrolase [Lautropia sp.]